MARYMKGTVNNNWQRFEDSETPVRHIAIVPDTDEVLIRRFARVLNRYRLERLPEDLAYLQRTAAELKARGISNVPDAVA